MSIEDDIIVKRGEWRVGRKVPINVYEGDAPVCQCHTPEMAQRIVDAMKAMTKPEGPAQEPQCPTCGSSARNVRRNVCMGDANPWHISVPATQAGSKYPDVGYNAGGKYPPLVPATPAPSQPAGAREQAAIHLVSEAFSAFLEMTDGKPELDTRWMREAEELLCGGSPPAQQTAAKNAALVAAERERDSLREFLESEIHDDHCECPLCRRIRKALKAGKDGRQ